MAVVRFVQNVAAAKRGVSPGQTSQLNDEWLMFCPQPVACECPFCLATAAVARPIH
jgi:hypothetical protein